MDVGLSEKDVLNSQILRQKVSRHCESSVLSAMHIDIVYMYDANNDLLIFS